MIKSRICIEKNFLWTILRIFTIFFRIPFRLTIRSSPISVPISVTSIIRPIPAILHHRNASILPRYNKTVNCTQSSIPHPSSKKGGKRRKRRKKRKGRKALMKFSFVPMARSCFHFHEFSRREFDC